MNRRRVESLEDLPSQLVRPLRGLDPERLRTWSVAGGQRYVGVDFSASRDRRSIFAALGRAFELPDWFGANLDALYDSLTDLEPGPGYLVLLDRLPATKDFGVEQRDALLDVFRDVVRYYADTGVPFRVFYR
jgi:RNAse (barnase) inhibitor barstar